MASIDPDGMDSTALIIKGKKIAHRAYPAGCGNSGEYGGKFAYSAPMPYYSLGEGMGSS
jgi:hypothetical protein